MKNQVITGTGRHSAWHDPLPAFSDPEIRHAICNACGRRGLISKMHGRCVGTTRSQAGVITYRAVTCARKARKLKERAARSVAYAKAKETEE